MASKFPPKTGPEIEHMEDPGLVTAADVATVNSASDCEICARVKDVAGTLREDRMVGLAFFWRPLCEDNGDCIRGGTVFLTCKFHGMEIMKKGIGCPSCGDPSQVRRYTHVFNKVEKIL